jgi:hypothetical protein
MRAAFQFPKAQREQWSSWVNAFFADKWAALHAQVVMVIAGRARHWVRH